MKQYRPLIALLLFGLLLPPIPASAYLVGPPLMLQQTAAQSDLIVKAQVLSSQEAQDSWLGTMPGTTVEETRLKVVSALKGGASCPIIAFRHYKQDRTQRYISMGPEPVIPKLEPGRTYLIFAKAAGAACTYRQLWKVPPGIGDQEGVFLCADAQPVIDQELHPIVWHELTGLLQSRDSQDKLYALHQLDSMSGDHHERMTLSEFDRSRVLAVIVPLLHGSDPKVKKAALAVVAGRSPYLYEETGTHWTPRRYLIADPQIVASPSAPRARAARPYLLQIFSLANGDSDASVRALAIQSLADLGAPNSEAFETRWADDAQPQVRAAATLMLASDPTPAGKTALSKLSRDTQSTVRASVALGIERAQDQAALPLLSGLLHDANLDVREAAASSLASFPVEQTRDILRTNLADPDFKSMFLDNLAEDDPAPYLDGLTEVVEHRLVPPHFLGNFPDVEAWKILFKSLGEQSQAALTSDKWVHYMDVLETAEVRSSSEPRDLYAFYVSHHMTGRARRFRQASKTATPLDMEYFYNEVDKEAASGQLRP